MIGKRLLCLLGSLNFMLAPINTTTIIQSRQLIEVQIDNKKVIHSNFEEFKIQYEKKKLENEKKKAEEERLKKEKELEEQKKQIERDKLCYYNPYNVSEPSGISVEKAYKLLEGTTYQTWECATEFVNAEKLNPSVNAIFLISLTRYESGHGTNPISIKKNNISSWRVSRGWKGFSSKVDCISQTSKMISEKYLKADGEYNKGNDIWSIGKSYCETNNWAKDINIISNELRRK